jgi:hypothetical protein
MAPETASISAKQILSLGDLLIHENPPLSQLCVAKNIAKSADVRLYAWLPSPVAYVLYISAIAAALVRCGKRITKINDAQLRQGFLWTTQQEWVWVRLRDLAESALEKIALDE